MKPLGKVVKVLEIMKKIMRKVVTLKNVFCSYFHGPILVRNQHLADRIIQTAAQRRHAKCITKPLFNKFVE